MFTIKYWLSIVYLIHKIRMLLIITITYVLYRRFSTSSYHTISIR